MDDNFIRFGVIQALTFTLGWSLFTYFVLRFLRWLKVSLFG